jgi:membrane associated rhomboid family serine protease
VVAFIVLLAVLGTLAYRVTSPEERARYLDIALKAVGKLRVAATQRHPESDAFRDVLRARMPHMVITPAIAAVSVAVFISMLFGAGAISDPDTLVRWGASLGPRTTNGEWWRLVTSSFVHIGMFHLLVNVAILIQLGAVLERLLGRPTFAAVYISAGAFAGLINLSSYPVAVSVGASAAVFGLYGLLMASMVWQAVHYRGDQTPDAEQSDAEQIAQRPVRIPLRVLTRLGYGAALFLVCNAVNGLAGAPEFAGLLAGLVYGLVLGRHAASQHPRIRYVAAATAASCVIALACAAPLRNIVDVKPEIARVVATEERTAAAYQSALDAFRKGRMTAEALAKLAEGTIMPALLTVDARLQALGNVPPEYQPLVSDAREYVRLRCVSWRLRADAIRRTNAAPRRPPTGAADASGRLQMEARFRSNLVAEGNAESAELASLAMFHRIRP